MCTMEYFCNVKYIDIASACDDGTFHDINQFVKHTEKTGHTSYDDLFQKVFETPPPEPIAGVYECVEPMALYHEVLWSSGIVVINGVGVRQVRGHDQLHHALEAGEYNILQTAWDSDHPLSICVDVARCAKPFNFIAL